MSSESSAPAGRVPRHVMVGPGSAEQGGVASVVGAYAQAGLFDSGAVALLASYSAGGRWAKLGAALRAWLRYVGMLLRRCGAVLHVHVSSRASFWRKAMFIWAAWLGRRRIVFHLHGGGFRPFIEQLSPWARALALATMRRSDCLLCLSEPTRVWLQALLPGARVMWWPNPVPLGLFSRPADETVREPVLLYLGALLPAKRLADLLQAFAKLHAARPEARLVIGGTGPELSTLQAQAARLGLAQAISFAGWLDGNAKAGWLARSRVLALASETEAQPMVLLEAMAAGLPVLSTAVGGVPDLIRDEQEGLLVPVGEPQRLFEALLRLWDDEALRRRLSEQAWARAQRHRADIVCGELLRLYETLALRGS